MLKILGIQTVAVLDRNRLLSPSVLPYCTSQAEVSTAAEHVAKLRISVLTLSVKLAITKFTVQVLDSVSLRSLSAFCSKGLI